MAFMGIVFRKDFNSFASMFKLMGRGIE